MNELKEIYVVAAGLKDPALKGKHRVSMEGRPDKHIDEQTPRLVPMTAYYHRLIHLRGELREVSGDELKKLQSMAKPAKPKPQVRRDAFGDPIDKPQPKKAAEETKKEG
jgi:hypothetical protein